MVVFLLFNFSDHLKVVIILVHIIFCVSIFHDFTHIATTGSMEELLGIKSCSGMLCFLYIKDELES